MASIIRGSDNLDTSDMVDLADDVIGMGQDVVNMGNIVATMGGSDYTSEWFNVYSDANYTITHNLGTSDIMALIQIQGLGNGYTILSPSMSFPYYDINKPSGISTWTTSTQVKMRTGRGLFFYRAQSSHTGHGVSYENYSNDPMSIRVLVWKL